MTSEIKITAYPGNVENICLFVIDQHWKSPINFFVDKRNHKDLSDISLVHSIFNIEGIVEIMGRDNTLTLKKDHLSKWQEIGPLVGKAIREAIQQNKAEIPSDLNERVKNLNTINLGGSKSGSQQQTGINLVPKFSKEEMSEVPLTDDKALAIKQLLTDQINPALASHGGKAELVGMSEERVFLVLGGGCQGCGMASQTLKQGIEKAIKEKFPFVKEVVDTTDHMSGTNPYYSA